MPKAPTHALVWIPESAFYEIWTQGRRECFFQASDEAAWLAWLESHGSFSFRGQRGSLNARKENRQRGSGYWYGYRGLEKRSVKRYLGPAARVTLARLEEVAGEFAQAKARTDVHVLSAEDGAGTSLPTSDIGRPEHAPLLLPLSLKFRPPRLREQLVERPRLVQLLENGRACGLALISAPTGFGKTTLVSQWLASFQKEEPAVAWVSLDERDNDVVRFWRCVVRASQEMLGERTQKVLDHLLVPGKSPSLLEMPVLELVLTTFLNELAAIPGHGVIVLEDYHFISLPQIHASLSFWLEHLPANLRVIMLTRHDPPLPLAQWRVRGMLHEMRSDTLRFTAGETALFLQRHSTHAISHTDMMRLLERTEGWVAGLQLAVLALNAQGIEETDTAGEPYHQRSRADVRQPDRKVEESASDEPGSQTANARPYLRNEQLGDSPAVSETVSMVSRALQSNQRYIADYLVQEVLQHLPENVQLFLEQTALLERLQGRLCEAVTGQPEGQRMLVWLEQANLFLVPLDETRQWYRYHHLFREVLLQRLAQRTPEEVAELHRRAARWFLHEQMPAEAIAHAHEAKDFITLTEIIEQSQADLLQRGENATLVSWINLLPEAVLLERLSIFFLACAGNMAIGRTRVTAGLLNTYAHRHHLPATGTCDIDELERALCEHVGQRFPRQQDDYQRRIEVICGFLGFYATLALVMESNVALYQQIRQRAERYTPPTRLRKQESWLAALLQGDVRGAIADLMENLTESTARQDNTILFAHIYPTLTFLLMTTGQLQMIESIALRMLQRQDTLDARLNHGPALIDLGSVAYERNQLAQAEASLQAGLPLCHYPASRAAHYRGLLTLAKIKRVQGDRDTTQSILQELEVELSRSNLEAGALKNWRGLLAWEMLELRDERYARLWIQDNPVAQDLVPRLNPLSAHIYLMQAYFLLRFSRNAEAETLLSTLSGWAKQLELHGLRIPLLALQAILAQARGEGTCAETTLKEALVLAEASGYARTFFDLGEEVIGLLLRLRNQRDAGSQGSSARYLERLLASARDDETRGSPMEPAFPQPLIEPLSRREQEVLCEINEGYSNQEISRRLVISSSTVKSHINSIYRKLQAKSRTQALARARALNLFPQRTFPPTFPPFD